MLKIGLKSKVAAATFAEESGRYLGARNPGNLFSYLFLFLKSKSWSPRALSLAEHHDHLVPPLSLNPLEHLNCVGLDRALGADEQVCGDCLPLPT